MNGNIKIPPILWHVPTLDHDEMMFRRFQAGVHPQGRIERRIVWNLIHHLAANGFTVNNVYDGDEVTQVADAKAAMELIFNLDEASVRFRSAEGYEYGVWIVLGNGIDCIADWNYTEGDPDGFSAIMDAFDTERFA